MKIIHLWQFLPKKILDAINRYYPLEGAKEAIEELGQEKIEEGVKFGEIKEEDILGTGRAKLP